MYPNREACISKQGGTTGITARPCEGAGFFYLNFDFIMLLWRNEHDYRNEPQCYKRKFRKSHQKSGICWT